MSGFSHGVKITDTSAGVSAIATPETCVIFLVGTAPVHLGSAGVNTLSYVGSEAAAATFGPDQAGYTIPSALAAILAYGTAKVVVVNVFDPATHKTSVPSEPITLGADGTATLAHKGVISATVKNQAGTTTHVLGTDYTLDKASGRVARITGGAIAAAAQLTVAYEYGDPSKVLPADIIGTVNEAGKRTGLQLAIDVPTTFGYKPRILLVPAFNTQATVIAALAVMADKIDADAYLDAPVGTTFAQALASRGADGTLNWNVSSPNLVLCYPHVQVAGDSGQITEPFSQNLAGLASSVDYNKGYWYSFSNNEMKRVNALERPIEWRSGDDSCEASQLNAMGIVTAVRRFGTGFLAWGNRNASFPSSSGVGTFIPNRVVSRVLSEILERVGLKYVDGPYNKAWLDSIKEDCNSEFASMVQKGALLGATCTWSADDNPATEIAQGHSTFEISWMGGLPVERITFRKVLDSAWLTTLYGSASE